MITAGLEGDVDEEFTPLTKPKKLRKRRKIGETRNTEVRYPSRMSTSEMMQFAQEECWLQSY